MRRELWLLRTGQLRRLNAPVATGAGFVVLLYACMCVFDEEDAATRYQSTAGFNLDFLRYFLPHLLALSPNPPTACKPL